MPRPLRYTLIGLLWAAVAGYIVYSAARVRTHRRQLVVQRLDIEIADSSSHGQLVTGGAVRQWLARSGVKTVRIIHGKGTGALRKAVTDFLRKDKRIASVRLGNWGEGDTGVSIAELK